MKRKSVAALLRPHVAVSVRVTSFPRAPRPYNIGRTLGCASGNGTTRPSQHGGTTMTARRSLWMPTLLTRRPALSGSLYPPISRASSKASAQNDDAEDTDDDEEGDQLAREFDEFEAEELFEDEAITDRPQQKATAAGDADAAVMKEISDLNLSGEQYHCLGMWEDAERAFREALAIIDENLGAHHQSAAIVLNNLAMACRRKGDLEEAEGLLQQALHIRRAHFGASHPRVALILDHLGALYRQQKRINEALEMFKQSLAIIEEFDTKKKQSSHDGDQTKSNVEDESLALETDDISSAGNTETTTENDDTDWEDLINLATARNNLGLAYYQLEDYAHAEALFESAVSEAKRREHERAELERRGEAGELQVKRTTAASSVAVMQKNLALCLLKQGKLDQSEHHLKDALDYLREEVGLRDHDELVLDVFRQLARVYTAMGKPTESAFYADKVARHDQQRKAAQ